MRVVTWNVNDVRKRLPLLLEWLGASRPDVVALQELKCSTAEFPAAELEAAGYRSVVVGQRAWNGVALLARAHAPLPLLKALPGDPYDKEARYVEAAINGVLFGCLYLPNGNPWPSPKFDYKIRWFERMRQRAAELWATGQPVVLLGDWNVVPTDADIYKPDTWRDNALLQPEPRKAYAEVLAQGWTDALKQVHPNDPQFTFWDYRRNRWQRNAGLRIDHILVSGALQVVDAGVDRDLRGAENASDHAPVWADIQLLPARKMAARKKAGVAVAAKSVEPLSRYNAKRDFSKTAEPSGRVVSHAVGAEPGPLQFVIQKHWASRLHYDFRLEFDGVMLSWAVPKGPSFDPAVKQMAIHVEDHPLDYNAFEGTIPKGEYGGGKVIVWDRGIWEPVGDAREGMAKGKVMFKLHGQKLAGLWELVRISKPGEKKQDQWMLFKKRGDPWARPASEYDVITALPDSVVDKPLGLVEEREPRQSTKSSVPATRAAPDVAADMRHAVSATLPQSLKPQLATPVSAVPPGDWIVETKFDGYRILARIEGRQVKLYTRNGHDWSARLAKVCSAITSIGVESAWLDGEIVVLNDAGVPDFNGLQNAIDSARGDEIVMFVFDVPFLDGKDLRRVPLTSRRELLKELLEDVEGDTVRLSTSFEAVPEQMLNAACQLGLEGVMVKRADASYVSGRTETWLKLKCQLRQEFVVIGFHDRSGGKHDVGGLMLGYYENGKLRSAGSVGTGWGAATGRDLHKMLSAIETKTPTVDPQSVKPGRWSRRAAGQEHWVKPIKVVEVAFSEWTPEGHVRHPVFRGVREDKPAGQIIRETAKTPEGATPASSTGKKVAQPSSVKVSNPDRVIDPSAGFRKIDLVRYYEAIADWILPHLKDRPVSLVRAPTGITGQLFFQKHLETKMPGMRELDPDLWPGHTALLGVDGIEALLAAAQMNTVEFHTWNSTVKRINQPDRVIFDLDPGEGVSWKMLQEAAVLTRTLLTELGLEAWLKTSGGKGLHVVVPLAPKLDYEVVKSFSQAAVRHMAKVIPSRFVAVSGGTNRVGKIFVDYLRNGHGQTTASAFSARSRPGLGVSMPVTWEQLPELKSGSQWTIATAREYVSFQRTDPWAGYWKKRQSLVAAMKALGLTTKAKS